MNLREVTIGRSKDCDIFLDPQCQYASSHHATIYYDGNQLMFRDTSTNGTLINNINVHRRAVPIHHGDTIMLAGQYPLTWPQIDSFFPPAGMQRRSGTAINAAVADRASEPAWQPAAPSVPSDLDKWSWGAFQLNWIWGLFNGCWWMILIFFGIVLLYLGFFILGFIAHISVMLLFGFKGRRWAWENRSWSSVESFVSTQHTWDIVGLVFFIIWLLSIILGVIGLLTVGISLFSYL